MKSSHSDSLLDDYVEVGWVHSTQGVRGQVFVSISAGEAVWSKKWSELIIASQVESEASNAIQKQIFKINSIRNHAKQGKWGFVLDLDGVHSCELAEKIVGGKVFIPKAFFVSEPGENIYLREVLGFEVFNTKSELQGKVCGFSSNLAQDIIIIEYDDKIKKNLKFEVPFVKELIIDINFQDKKIIMDIPEGLKFEV